MINVVGKWKAIKAEVPHNSAWRQEKSRSRATMHRRVGVAKRALERQELEIKWFEEHGNKERKRKITDLLTLKDLKAFLQMLKQK